jgi:hypothetical protein
MTSYMMALGFRNVAVEIETDTLFTVIGRIDKDRRQNLAIQFQAMRPHLIKILGSEAKAPPPTPAGKPPIQSHCAWRRAMM